MAGNPFDVGGAFVDGFAGGQRVGQALGDRWNRYQINRQAKRAAAAEKQLYDAGALLDDGSIDMEAVGDDEGLKTAIAERSKRNSKLRDVVMRQSGRGVDAEAQLDNALMRFDPYGVAPRRGVVSAVMLNPDGTPQEEGETPTVSYSATPAEDPNRLERTVGQRKAAILGTSEAAQLEQIGRKAVPQIFGKMAPYLERVRDGKYAQDDIDNIGGGLQAMTMYVPEWRGAQVWWDGSGKTFYVDKPGEADGNGISMPLDTLSRMTRETAERAVFGGSQDLEAGYKTGLANEAARAARGDKAAQASVELLKALMPSVANDAATATAISTGFGNAAKAGFKYEAVEPEAALARFGQSNVMAVSTPSGVTIYNAITPADKTGTGVPTNQWLDVQGQPLDRARAEAMMSAAPGLVESISALSQLKNSNLLTAFQAINTAAAAVAAGAPAEFDFQGEAPAASAITPRGVSPSTRGGERGRLAAETDDYINKITANVTSPAYVAKHGQPPEGDARALAEWALPALVQQESGGDPNAVSPVGARGTFQIMPDTAANPGYGITPIADWNNASQAEQREFAIQYLTKGIEKGGSLAAGLAFYNGGERQMNNLLSGAASGERMAAAVQQPTSVVPPRVATSARERERMRQQPIKGVPPMAEGGVVLSPELLDFLRN